MVIWEIIRVVEWLINVEKHFKKKINLINYSGIFFSLSFRSLFACFVCYFRWAPDVCSVLLNIRVFTLNVCKQLSIVCRCKHIFILSADCWRTVTFARSRTGQQLLRWRRQRQRRRTHFCNIIFINFPFFPFSLSTFVFYYRYLLYLSLSPFQPAIHKSLTSHIRYSIMRQTSKRIESTILFCWWSYKRF